MQGLLIGARLLTAAAVTKLPTIAVVSVPTDTVRSVAANEIAHTRRLV
jgi:hypothetical protein